MTIFVNDVHIVNQNMEVVILTCSLQLEWTDEECEKFCPKPTDAKLVQRYQRRL